MPITRPDEVKAARDVKVSFFLKEPSQNEESMDKALGRK
jgi:hypothetical protein